MEQQYHVHIYEVTKKFEVDLEASRDQEAVTKAIEMARSGELSETEKDCRFIVYPILYGEPIKIFKG